MQDLEEALLTHTVEEVGSSLIQDLIVRLLKGCFNSNKDEITSSNYQMYLRRLFRVKCEVKKREELGSNWSKCIITICLAINLPALPHNKLAFLCKSMILINNCITFYWNTLVSNYCHCRVCFFFFFYVCLESIAFDNKLRIGVFRTIFMSCMASFSVDAAAIAKEKSY